MADVIFRIYGLCAFANPGKESWLYMPTAMNHRPVMFTKARRITPDTTWTPDCIFYDETGVQQVGWNLSGRNTGFKEGKGSAKWTNHTNFFDFTAFHGKAPVTQGDAAGFRLHQGELTTATATSRAYDVRYPHKDRLGEPIAQMVEWTSTGNGFVLTSNDQDIEFVNPTTVSTPTIVTITNVAPTRVEKDEENTHFHHYYDCFTKPPAARVTLVTLGPDVFDCVPPANLPG